MTTDSALRSASSHRSGWWGLLILLGVLLVGFFGLRTAHAFQQMRQHGLHSSVIMDVEEVRDWMTVPHIARTYRVPEPYLFEQLQIPPEENRPKSLDQLNQEYAPDQPSWVLETVKAALRQYQAEHPTPPPSP